MTATILQSVNDRFSAFIDYAILKKLKGGRYYGSNPYD